MSAPQTSPSKFIGDLGLDSGYATLVASPIFVYDDATANPSTVDDALKISILQTISILRQTRTTLWPWATRPSRKAPRVLTSLETGYTSSTIKLAQAYSVLAFYQIFGFGIIVLLVTDQYPSSRTSTLIQQVVRRGGGS